MPEKNDIPIFRNLDGVYYRVVRDGIHVNRCFSDLSEAEQDVIMAVVPVVVTLLQKMKMKHIILLLKAGQTD